MIIPQNNREKENKRTIFVPIDFKVTKFSHHSFVKL